MATEFRSIEDAVRGIEKSTYEIQTESRLVYSGLKREQNIAAILEKYAWLYNPETVRRVEETYRAETDAENKERLRRVYYYLLDGYIGQRTAPQEDELVSFEADATVEVDGERIPYHNVPVLIAGEHDFERRTRLRDASLEVVEATNRVRLEILRTSLATLANEFGHSDYTAYNAEKKRIDYSLLRSRMENFLSETEETYAALMGRWVEETTGRRLGEIGSHHFSYISRVPQYDAVLSQGQATRRLRKNALGAEPRPRVAEEHPHRRRTAGDQEPQGSLLCARPSKRGSPADQASGRPGRLHGLLPRGGSRPALRQ